MGLPIEDAEYPELYPHLLLVWAIYQILRNSRQLGFGTIWFIPLTEIKAALDLYEVVGIGERVYYTGLLQQLDQFYVGWWVERNADKPGKSK